MLIEDRQLQTPTSDTVEVWRYMTLAKFLSMLATRQMWFSSLEELTKTDPHEGGLALPNYRHRRVLSVEELSEKELQELDIDPRAALKDRQDAFQNYRILQEYHVRRRERYRRAMFINCWHMNSGESAAMWAAYAPGGESVAIVSTYRSLSLCLEDAEQRIVPYRVDYEDFLKELVKDKDQYPYPITKRLSFAHENELRLIYVDEAVAQAEFGIDRQHAQAIFQLRPGADGKLRQTTVEDYNFDQVSITRSSQPPGIAVNVKMEDLVGQVRVAPNATDWFTFAVQEACSRFCLSKNIVKRSDITSERFS